MWVPGTLARDAPAELFERRMAETIDHYLKRFAKAKETRRRISFDCNRTSVCLRS